MTGLILTLVAGYVLLTLTDLIQDLYRNWRRDP